MALFKFKSKGKTRQLVDLIYPVGTIYESTSSTNPGTLFGGTWETFGAGRVLIGAGQGNDGTTSMSFTAGSTGGLYQVPLTIDNIPDHRHDQFQYYEGQTPTTQDYRCNSAVWSYAAKESYSTGDITNKDKTTPHSNIQPYQGIYRWRRIS